MSSHFDLRLINLQYITNYINVSAKDFVFYTVLINSIHGSVMSKTEVLDALPTEEGRKHPYE